MVAGGSRIRTTAADVKYRIGDHPINQSRMSCRISCNRSELNTDNQIFDYTRLPPPHHQPTTVSPVHPDRVYVMSIHTLVNQLCTG